MFELPKLPYAKDALVPYISSETIEYHYGRHHQTYVNNLNLLIQGTDYERKTLEEIILSSSGAIFNNAAQVWNHTFYWNSMSPESTGVPEGNLKHSIDKDFGSLSAFKKEFSKLAASTFGSGWVWLVKDCHGKLVIMSTSNANCPLTDGYSPIMTCDVWEHAYYIDYRNTRPNYIKNFWEIVNWNFASGNFMALTEDKCS